MELKKHSGYKLSSSRKRKWMSSSHSGGDVIWEMLKQWCLVLCLFILWLGIKVRCRVTYIYIYRYRYVCVYVCVCECARACVCVWGDLLWMVRPILNTCYYLKSANYVKFLCLFRSVVSWSTFFSFYTQVWFGLVCWVLWHINLCRLFNAKTIFM